MWALCLCALLFGAVATSVLDFNGPGYAYALIAFVWFVVVLFVYTAASEPIYAAFLEPDGRVLFVWQYPHKRVSRVLEPAAIPEPEILTSRDSDDDRRVVAKITFADGSEFIVAEPPIQIGHSKKFADRELRFCERACARFSDAVSQL